ncbi:MAG: M48 family metallopeptidase [Kiritimatiellaeota bacterium]|nr:M48 family metallopeptidase [Kiritimatiellota bacterium]
MYILAVIGVALTLHLGIALLVGGLAASGGGDDDDSPPRSTQSEFVPTFTSIAFNRDFALWVFGLTLALIGFTSLYKIAKLRSGGSVVAESMGGRKILPTTRDLRERRLLNVVEEMALAAGIAMPSVYVLDRERGMNAFAAGFSSKDAAVAVTRGLLETLNRDELQGVIGHEFSHILNGDMRLNIRLVGILHGILAIAIIGMFIIRMTARMKSSSSRKEKDNSGGAKLALILFGLILWLVGQIGVFFGRLIQSSVSRQREFLADASAVQFTRNPGGLASALKLIGAKTSALTAPNTADVSHMLFASGLKSMFATHPPLLVRIRTIEPGFNGDFAETQALLQRRADDAKAPPKASADGMDAEDERVIRNTMYGVRRALRYEGGDAVPPPLPETAKAAQPPNMAPPPLPIDLSWLSDDDRDMLHDPLSAECCVCGALLDNNDTNIRDRQLEMLPHRFENDTDMTAACLAWQERMRGWTVRQRRIVCELAVATLRNAAPDNLAAFCASIDKLVRADGVIEPFEFALTCMIRRRLQTDAALAHARQSTVPPKELATEIAHVLSMVADSGADDAQAVQAAWEVGKQRVTPYTGELVMTDSAALRDFDAFDAVLSKLERLPPLFKRELMQACHDIASHDGIITDTEENFLFAIADAIDAIGWNATV